MGRFPTILGQVTSTCYFNLLQLYCQHLHTDPLQSLITATISSQWTYSVSLLSLCLLRWNPQPEWQEWCCMDTSTMYHHVWKRAGSPNHTSMPFCKKKHNNAKLLSMTPPSMPIIKTSVAKGEFYTSFFNKYIHNYLQFLPTVTCLISTIPFLLPHFCIFSSDHHATTNNLFTAACTNTTLSRKNS